METDRSCPLEPVTNIWKMKTAVKNGIAEKKLRHLRHLR